jgi:hypothetical protein
VVAITTLLSAGVLWLASRASTGAPARELA